MTGIVLAQLALTVLVYVRTGSPLLSALVFATGFLPQLIAGTLFSALVDRLPARRLLVGCNVVSGVLAAVMAIPAAPVAVLLVLAFLLGLIRPVFLGARSASIKDVLPGGSFVPGRSLIRLVSQGAQIGGFAVSGLLLTVISARTILLINAVCFAVAALLLQAGTHERVPLSTRSAHLSLLTDSLTGIRDVMSIGPLRRLLLFGWIVPALAVTPEALAVPYAASLGAGTAGAGVLLTALPAGTLLGEALTNWMVSPERQARIVTAAAALTFVPLLCFAFHPGIPLALAALFVSGLGAALYLGLDRLILRLAPEDLLARTLSIEAAGVMFWQGIGYAAAGAAAEAVRPTVVIPVAAVCGLVVVAMYAVASGARRAPAPVPATIRRDG
jgi:Na+/melibiose symporter-like transporter